MLYASYTDTGGRPYNEDTVAVQEQADGRLCAVLADGLGGHGGGQIASRTAADAILSGWRGDATPALLSDLVQQAHREVLARQTPACKMKSTAVVLSLSPRDAVWAYVGDSRLYHFIDGRLHFQTRDHSASQIAVLLGQITPDQIRFHEDRSRIFRALGQENGLTVDAGTEALAAGRHSFLLCSDGFWEYVYEREMEQTLACAVSPQDWLDRMRKLLASRVRGDNDNNTAAAVWLTV